MRKVRREVMPKTFRAQPTRFFDDVVIDRNVSSTIIENDDRSTEESILHDDGVFENSKASSASIRVNQEESTSKAKRQFVDNAEHTSNVQHTDVSSALDMH